MKKKKYALSLVVKMFTAKSHIKLQRANNMYKHDHANMYF